GFSIDMLAGGISVDFVHQTNSVVIAVVGIMLGSLGFRDTHGVACFKEFQWQVGVQNYRIEFIASWNVATALQKFILGIHRLSRAFGVLANYVFEHDDIAGLTHRIIRFRGDDQSEGLKIGGDVQLTAAVIAY